jgi:PmbA protein
MVREGEVERLTEAASRTMALRVFVDGRTALVYSADVGEDTLAPLVRDAIAIARLAPPDPHAGLPDGPFAGADDRATLDLFDEEASAQDPQHLIALARRCEAAARGHDPRISNSAGTTFTRWQEETALANTRGFAGHYRASGCSLEISVVADDADNKKRPAYWLTTDRRFARLEEAEEVGRTAARRALRQLGARQVTTQEVPVVWAPEVARDFARLIAAAASGEMLNRGSTFLVGREGAQVASPLVTIVDDATIPGELGSRPFDEEGLASRRTPIIEAGRFQNFLFDAYHARKAGRVSTANAGRTIFPLQGVTAEVTPSNLLMAAGHDTPEAIIGGVERGLYLTGLLGSGLDLTTGDFSRGAGGIWIENGRLAYPVAEVNVSGRLQDMLTGIDAVGNDASFVGTLSAPTFRISRMMVSGL